MVQAHDSGSACTLPTVCTLPAAPRVPQQHPCTQHQQHAPASTSRSRNNHPGFWKKEKLHLPPQSGLALMSAKMSDEKTDLEQPATLQVSGEGEVKLDSPPEEKEPSIHTQTPEDRDPGRINDYVKVQFHEIFAEPDTEVYSFDKIWRLSFTVFTQTKIWCYRITSVVLAIPLAVMWGCYFACLSFCTFWCCIPCLRCKEIELDCFKKFWTLCCDSTLGPCYDAIGRIFSNIRVHQSKD